ncbi:MAG: MFS transporter [Gammaproteobacteria bacterium]|nr:MFS transporter [Gammaproteobacteria bacterium]
MQKKSNALITWFIATLFVVYSFCLNTASAVFFGAIKQTLHASNIGASLATGSFILGFALMQIPAGYLLDKYNPKWGVSLGILLLASGNVLLSFSSNLVSFSLSTLCRE